MGKCIIFCAAGFDSLVQPIETEDFVIAADGGVTHTKKLGMVRITEEFAEYSAKDFALKRTQTASVFSLRRGFCL